MCLLLVNLLLQILVKFKVVESKSENDFIWAPYSISVQWSVCAHYHFYCAKKSNKTIAVTLTSYKWTLKQIKGVRDVSVSRWLPAEFVINFHQQEREFYHLIKELISFIFLRQTDQPVSKTESEESHWETCMSL